MHFSMCYHNYLLVIWDLGSLPLIFSKCHWYLPVWLHQMPLLTLNLSHSFKAVHNFAPSYLSRFLSSSCLPLPVLPSFENLSSSYIWTLFYAVPYMCLVDSLYNFILLAHAHKPVELNKTLLCQVEDKSVAGIDQYKSIHMQNYIS